MKVLYIYGIHHNQMCNNQMYTAPICFILVLISTFNLTCRYLIETVNLQLNILGLSQSNQQDDTTIGLDLMHS